MPGYSETAVPTSAPADSACVWPVFVGQHSSPLSTSVKLVPAKNISLKSVLSYWPLALSFVSLLNQLSFTCFATHVAQALLPVLCLDLYSDHHPNPRQSALIRGKTCFSRSPDVPITGSPDLSTLSRTLRCPLHTMLKTHVSMLRAR